MRSIHRTGEGELYWGEKRLGTVSYSLTQIPPQPLRLGGPPKGTITLIKMEGAITAHYLSSLNSTLTLHLEDDQLLDVNIRGASYVPSDTTLEVDGTGTYRRG